jgi:hypothetical protein
MLDVLGLAQKDKDAISKSLEALSKKYDCVIDNDMLETFANRINGLNLLDDYHTVSIKNVFKISNNGNEFYILSIYLAEVDLKVDFTSLMFGALLLKKNHDRVLIKPENTWDRLMNIFGIGKSKIMELHGKKNKYRISFTGKNSSAHQLPQVFLDELSGMKKIYGEFNEKIFISTFNKSITVDDTLSIADFLSKIAPVLS